MPGFRILSASNFTYQSQLSVAVQTVQAEADIQVDWSQLITDVHGHTRNPQTDFNQVQVVAFPHLSPEEVSEALETDTLSQSDVGGFAWYQTAEPSCPIDRCMVPWMRPRM